MAAKNVNTPSYKGPTRRRKSVDRPFKLDRREHYGTVHGRHMPWIYEQDDRFFNAQFQEVDVEGSTIPASKSK